MNASECEKEMCLYGISNNQDLDNLYDLKTKRCRKSKR